MFRTLRPLIIRLLQWGVDIDEDVYVKIVSRDRDNVVTHMAMVHISYIDSHNNICVEERDIKFVPYNSSN